MLTWLLITTALFAQFGSSLGRKPEGQTLVHKTMAGDPIRNPKDCIEAEIKKRTVIIFMNDKQNCTGVIMDDQSIATAGHCHSAAAANARSPRKMTDPEKSKLSVLYFDPVKGYQKASAIKDGSIQFQGDISTGKVQFNSMDLMVLGLAKPIPGMTPLRVVKKEDLNTNLAQNLVIAGFGLDKNDNLQPLDLRYLKAKGKLITIDQKNLHTVTDNEDQVVKPGDSGGPVFRVTPPCTVELAGITSGTDQMTRQTPSTVAEKIQEFQILNSGLLKEDEGPWAATVKPAPKPVPAARPARK